MNVKFSICAGALIKLMCGIYYFGKTAGVTAFSHSHGQIQTNKMRRKLRDQS